MNTTIEEYIAKNPSEYRKIQNMIRGSLIKLFTDGFVVVRDSDMHVMSNAEIAELISRPFIVTSIETHDFGNHPEL